MITRTRVAAAALAASLALAAAPAQAAIPEPVHGPVPAVVVVCGDCLIDAAAAAPLAAVLGAPVVLVERSRFTPEAGTWLRSLRASEAFIIGGEDAVAPGVFGAVRSNTVDGAAERIGGADRYATSRLIAERVADLVAAGAGPAPVPPSPSATGSGPSTAAGPLPRP